MTNHAVRVCDPDLDTRLAERREALLRAQYAALARFVPMLYGVVIIATLTLTFAFGSYGPTWLLPWVPCAILVPVVIRMRYWILARNRARFQPLDLIERAIRRMVVIGALIGLGFAGVGVALLAFDTGFEQSIAAISIWIVAIASAFCVSAVPAASVSIALITSIPIAAALVGSGGTMKFSIAAVIAAVTALVLYILCQIAAAFHDMVISRQDLQRQNADAIRAREEAYQLAHTDHLTGLANRRSFEMALQKRVDAQIDNAVTPFAVAIIDLDGFKPVNDIHGHARGDDVLQSVAERLSRAAGRHATVARIGGDEFAILFDGIDTETAAQGAASAIQSAINSPFTIDAGHEMCLGASIGFAFYPTSSKDASRLMDLADMALYRSKAERRGTAFVFQPEQEQRMVERARIEQGLRKAISAKALDVHFQPILDLDSGRLTGFEALARWEDAELGRISPAVFIPIAEQCGLIEPLTDLLLRKAATTATRWPKHLTLSFNLSAEQLVRENAGLLILATLNECGLSARRFEAEVTETALMKDLERARSTIEHLRIAGCRISLDDFGTGYSSLSQIRNLPLDKVKIDKSFVDQIVEDERLRNLVRAIITMCEVLELRCVAEGIEVPAQLEALKGAGCMAGQGYLFARPASAEAISALISDDRRAGRKRAA